MYPTLDDFIQSLGGSECVSVRNFELQDEADSFFEMITNPNIRPHPNIASPLVPVFRVRDDLQFFVAVEKIGQSLEVFLRKQTNKMTFCDVIRYTAVKKIKGLSQHQKWSAKDKYIRIRISQAYRAIIRNIIEVNIHLKNAPFMCVLNLKSVMIYIMTQSKDDGVIDPIVKMTEFAIRDQSSNGEEWLALLHFITEINSNARLQDFQGLEMEILKSRLQNRDVEGILGIPFFRDTSWRIKFICSLSSYLEARPGFVFNWVPELEDAFGPDWLGKMKEYESLVLLLKQDEQDRQGMGLSLYRPVNPPATVQEKQKHIRECINLMRQLYEHFNRMKRQITEVPHQVFELHSRFQLQWLLDYIFPNHIQHLVDAVETQQIPI